MDLVIFWVFLVSSVVIYLIIEFMLVKKIGLFKHERRNIGFGEFLLTNILFLSASIAAGFLIVLIYIGVGKNFFWMIRALVGILIFITTKYFFWKVYKRK